MVLIITGFPSLSFTFKRSLSKLLARSEIFFFEYNGFAQYKPFFFILPTYFPKSNRTLELLGCTIIKPEAINRAVAIANKNQGFFVATIAAIPPVNNIKHTNSMT